jgi:hypothetical protein
MTPETVLVAINGIVTKVWFGAYSRNIANDMQNTFKIEKLIPLRLEQ